MKIPVDSADPPLAEPGKRPSGADVGGVATSLGSGVAEATQRSTEKGDESAAVVRTNSTGAASAKAGATRTNTSGSEEEDEDEWRHPPVAPVDERNPLKSLGEAVADTVTGSDADTPRDRKR